MVGISPEIQKRPLITVDNVVKIKKSKKWGEYVVTKFNVFKENEDEARRLFYEYLSEMQVGNDSSAREIDRKLLTLTQFSAADINAKRQERWAELAAKGHPTG
jgi:hypothetical protein